MLEQLKQEVYEANLQLVKLGLVEFTWGNVSGIDRDSGFFVIKPSGVSYEKLKAEDMVVVDLNGKVIEGKYRPSSDTPTHTYLYRNFSEIGGIVHTHSHFAVSFAAAEEPILALNTTHADTFYTDIPVTRALTKAEVETAYEEKTGVVITETFNELKLNPQATPGVLVAQHGPFTWGNSPVSAVYNAKVLEVVAEEAYHTLQIAKHDPRIPDYLLDKHYFRKHGEHAYYGQK